MPPSCSHDVLPQVGVGTRISSAVTVAEDKIFAATNDGYVKALDIVSGKELWVHKRAQRISTSIVFVAKDQVWPK